MKTVHTTHKAKRPQVLTDLLSSLIRKLSLRESYNIITFALCSIRLLYYYLIFTIFSWKSPPFVRHKICSLIIYFAILSFLYLYFFLRMRDVNSSIILFFACWHNNNIIIIIISPSLRCRQEE